MLIYYLVFVGLCVLVALGNYRLGLWLMLVAGLLADPIRKLTPGNPIFIQIAFISIFFAIYFVAILMKKSKKRLFYYFPKFKRPLQWFLVFLGINTVRPILVDLEFLPFVVYSLVQYLGLIVSIQLGFYLIRSENDMVRFVKIYILTLTPFLFSVLLHFLGLQWKWPVLQTMKFGEQPYVHWHAGITLIMRNGLFRNPEPMGWHAMIYVICCLFLLFRRKGTLFRKVLYAFSSFFGVWCILLSGRRKFLLSAVIFIIIFLILTMRKSAKKMIGYFLIMVVFFGLGWYYFESTKQEDIYIAEKTERESAYIKTGKSAFEAMWWEARRRMYGSILWAIGRDGFFGRGLGASTQGIHHLHYKLSRPMADGSGIEAGTGKLISELGVPGTFAFIILIWVYLHSIYKVTMRKRTRGITSTTNIFLLSLVLTNLICFFLSHQVYADPLIAVLTGLTFGFLLATPKMIEYEHG